MLRRNAGRVLLAYRENANVVFRNVRCVAVPCSRSHTVESPCRASRTMVQARGKPLPFARSEAFAKSRQRALTHSSHTMWRPL